jgi:hypothetical protein
MGIQSNRLFELLWPQGTDKTLTVWGSKTKKSVHLRQPTLDPETNALLFSRNGNGDNIYFGLASRVNSIEGEYERGAKSSCIELPAIALDIDVLNPDAHAAQNLPKDKADVLTILSANPLPPSFLVHTGNGFHAYWLFNSPLLITDPRILESHLANFQGAFIAKAKEHGWHLDKTHTVDRVWRLPGFMNLKTNLPVRLLAPENPVRYEPTSLGISESKGVPPLQRKTEPLPHKPQSQSSEIPSTLLTSLHNLKDQTKREQFAKLLEGDSPASKGERDAVLHAMASTLVFADEGKTTPKALAELFRPAMQLWADESSANKTVDEEMSKVLDKLNRAQGDFFQKQAKEEQSLEAIRVAFMSGQDTAEDSAAAAKEVSPKHFIIQKDRAYYPFDFQTLAYDRARTQTELHPYLRDCWEGASAELYRMNEKGEMRLRTIADLTMEYATVANDIIFDLAAQSTYFDPRSKVLFSRAAPNRTLTPKFHPIIDEWLRAMPESPEDVDLLLNWIAGVTELRHQCAAIYLSGPPDVGKSLLAYGLGMLWLSEAPSKMSHIVARFNSSLLDCPLIVLDEQWSDKRVNICGEIRELIGTTSHRVEQKGLTPVTLKGAVRIMITANNDSVLSAEGNGEMTENDRQATAERILHIVCSLRAKAILEGQTERFTWIANGDIARHALWLKEERFETIINDRARAGRRYLVQGRYKKEFHDGIGQKQDDFYAVAEILIQGVLSAKGPFGSGKVARVHRDEFRVTSKGVLDSWQTFLGDRYDMPKNNTAIGRVLSQMGQRTFDKLLDANVYRIKKEYLCEQAEKLELATPENIEIGFKQKVFQKGDGE